jgi:hypothetical protein
MKSTVKCILFSILCTLYTNTSGSYRIEYSPELKEILEHLRGTTDEIPAHYTNLDITTRKEDRMVVGKFLIKMSLEDLGIGASIALDQENREVGDCFARTLLMKLIHHIKCIYIAYYKHFEMTYEEARRIEILFDREIRLQEQKRGQEQKVSSQP